jgi:hypothetical protein
LAKLGGELRKLHLLENIELRDGIADFPLRGNGEVEKVQYEPAAGKTGGRVYINDTQFFDNVPPEAWEFYIGGYQPAQKWLKDRKGRKLEYDDVLHYRKIIRVLIETARVMGEI